MWNVSKSKIKFSFKYVVFLVFFGLLGKIRGLGYTLGIFLKIFLKIALTVRLRFKYRFIFTRFCLFNTFLVFHSWRRWFKVWYLSKFSITVYFSFVFFMLGLCLSSYISLNQILFCIILNTPQSQFRVSCHVTKKHDKNVEKIFKPSYTFFQFSILKNFLVKVYIFKLLYFGRY